MESRQAAQTAAELPQVVQIYTEAAARLGMTVRILDPEYGYLFEVSDGTRSVRLLGGRSPLNDAVAARLCEDKYYTGLILERAGFTVPQSVRCLDPDYFRLDKYEGRTGIEPGLRFASDLAYPVVVKPNRMSHGRDVTVAHDEAEVRAAVERIWRIDYIALVQQRIPGRDLRFDFVDGEYLAGYARSPVIITGNGRQTIREIIESADPRFVDEAYWQSLDRDTDWQREVAGHRWDQNTVLDCGVEINLGGDILNLNRWATAEMVPYLPPKWFDFCMKIGKAMNLSHFGVDIKVNGIDSEPRDATVIEVNSSPLLVQMYRMGQTEAAIEGYMRVLKAIFERQQ